MQELELPDFQSPGAAKRMWEFPEDDLAEAGFSDSGPPELEQLMWEFPNEDDASAGEDKDV